MKKYKFKVNNSNLEEFIIKVEANDFYEARNKAYNLCYKAGYCFMGRL